MPVLLPETCEDEETRHVHPSEAWRAVGGEHGFQAINSMKNGRSEMLAADVQTCRPQNCKICKLRCCFAFCFICCFALGTRMLSTMGGDDAPGAAVAASEKEEGGEDGSESSPFDVSQRQIDEFFPSANKKSKKRRASGTGSSASDTDGTCFIQGPTLWDQTAQESIRLHKRRALLLKRLKPLQSELSAVQADLASITTTKMVDTAENLSLVEVWSLVFRYLAYADMVQATAAWKFLLKEVAPLVEGLCFDHPREFGLLGLLVAAKRFPNVEKIKYRGREQKKRVERTSECKLVSFLCAFPKVFAVDIESLQLSRDANDAILEDICESYTYGMFSSKWIVNIYGISCLGDEIGDDDEQYPLCRLVCDSFPARGVANANFADPDTGWHDCRNGILGYMCISHEDGIEILASRYYGQKYIKSDDAILDVVADLTPYSKDCQGILDLYSGDIKHFEPLESFYINVSFAVRKISSLKKHGARPKEVDREAILGHLYKHAPGRIGEAYFYRCDFDELVEAGLPLKEKDFILVDDMKEVLKRKGLLPRDD